MKIALISPNKNHLQDMSKVLQAQSHAVILIDGGKSRMRFGWRTGHVTTIGHRVPIAIGCS